MSVSVGGFRRILVAIDSSSHARQAPADPSDPGPAIRVSSAA